MRLTSILSQLSVEKAIANNAADTIAVMVAMDRVTAEQGIFLTFWEAVKDRRAKEI